MFVILCVMFIIVEIWWYPIVKPKLDSRVCCCRVKALGVDVVLEFIRHILMLIVTIWSGEEFTIHFIQISSRKPCLTLITSRVQIRVSGSRIVVGLFHILFAARNL